MKAFSTYQYLDGEKMNDRDKLEAGSKYWNQGKWKHLVAPFFPKDVSEMTFVDMGCNAGLYLHLAEKRWFKRAVGVDLDKEAINRGKAWRDKHGYSYEFIHANMNDALEMLPVTDYMVFVNSHYYFKPEEWEMFVQKATAKVCNIIIVSAQKQPNPEFAASDTDGIRSVFKDWKETGFIDLPKDDTPHSRHLFSFCFENPHLHRVPIDSIDNGNAQQRDFLQELDKTGNPFKTRYYVRLKDYRMRKGSGQTIWSHEELTGFMQNRAQIYEDIRKNGLKHPVVVSGKNARIIDGNHRHEIMRHLGAKSIICKVE